VLERSFPKLLVNRVLRSQRALESGIFSPRSRDIAEIAVAASALADSSTEGQSLNCYFIQALALLASFAPKGRIQRVWYVADGILHAYIVGNAGIECKHSD
jgi:hypothetical protein